MAKNVIDLEIIESAKGLIYEVQNQLTEVINETNETYFNGEFEILDNMVKYLSNLKEEMRCALQKWD